MKSIGLCRTLGDAVISRRRKRQKNVGNLSKQEKREGCGFFPIGNKSDIFPFLYAGVPKKSLNPILNFDLIGDNLVSYKVSPSQHQISEPHE